MAALFFCAKRKTNCVLQEEEWTMPRKIKTRELVKNIKLMDKSRKATRQAKAAAEKAKTTAQKNMPSEGSVQSSEEYAAERVSAGENKALSAVGRRANRSRKRAIPRAKKNLGKAREYWIRRKSAKEKTGGKDKAEAVRTGGENSPKTAVRPIAEDSTVVLPDAQGHRARSASKMNGKSQTDGKAAAGRTIRQTKRDIKGTAPRSIKSRPAKSAAASGERAIRQSRAAAQKSRQAAQAVKKSRQSARAAAKSAKAAAKATVKAVQGVVTGTKALVSAVIAGGWVAVMVILVICMVGLLFSTPYGIFFAGEGSENERSLQEVMTELEAEYLAKIELVKANVRHDNLEMVGDFSIAWNEVLALYAVKMTSDPANPQEVVTITDEKAAVIRDILQRMNSFTHSVQVVEKEKAVSYIDGNGNEAWRMEMVRVVVLTVTAVRGSVAEVAVELGVDAGMVERVMAAGY